MCVCELGSQQTMSKSVGTRAVGETWYREMPIPTHCIHMFTDWSCARAHTWTISQMLTSKILHGPEAGGPWVGCLATFPNYPPVAIEGWSRERRGPFRQTHPLLPPRAGDVREQGSRPRLGAKTCDALPLAGSKRPWSSSFLSEEVVPSWLWTRHQLLTFLLLNLAINLSFQFL